MKKGLGKIKLAEERITREAQMEGWRLDGFYRLYNTTDEGVRCRLRVQKLSINLEHCVPLTDEEKNMNPNKFTKWEVIETMGLLAGSLEIKGNKVTFKKKK